MIIVIGSVVVAFLALATFLFFRQTAMIYHPQLYSAAQLHQLPKSVTILRDGDAVMGFYCPPADNSALQQLWLVFGGNADVALGWYAFANEHKKPGVGYVLIEYPGYGAFPGQPSPATILSATERTCALLATHLGKDPQDLLQRSCAIGHSLGAAAALQYAAQHPVQRLVLISPFTTMKAMAARVVGWPLCEMLTHRFDNGARLQEIISAGLPPTTIIHGKMDRLIPVTMGEALASLDPAIQLVVIADGEHNDVVDLADNEIRTAMGF